MHPSLYIITVFFNGFIVGASLNYSLAHVLHLTIPETHFIVTSLLATCRGFAGSFGSAIGSGIFVRILRGSLEAGFAREGLKGEEPLVRQLLGSPALVRRLEGVERAVAVDGYVDAIRGLFGTAAGFAILVILAQASVGWKGPGEKEIDEEEDEGIAVLADAEDGIVDPVDGAEPVPAVRDNRRT